MTTTARADAAPAGAGGAWTSNASIEDVALRLLDAKSVLIFTHAKADGDAVGATLALTRALIQRGADATCVYPGPWFSAFDLFVEKTPVLRLPEGPGALTALAPRAEPDTVCIVDTGAWSQLADVREWLSPRSAKAIVVDHHPSGDAGVAQLRCIQPRAAAAAEIVAGLCVRLLGLASPAALPVAIAEPLYLGLATDTGFFRYSSTTPATLRLAADLMEAGADHNRIYQASEQSDKPARLRLLGRAMSSVEFHASDRVAIVSLSRRDFEECGASLEDAGHMTDSLLAVRSVRAVGVITELDRGVTKVSLRSKPPTPDEPHAVDVNAAARTLGGGGHVRAAGAKVSATLEETKRRVIEALSRALA